MPWSTPDTTFIAADGFAYSDINATNENIAVLHKGNGQSSLSSIASASSLDIGSTDQTFIITGSTSINYISTTSREPGCVIHFINLRGGSNISFLDNTGSVPANYAALSCYNVVGGALGTITLNPGERFMFVYDGTYWYCTV